MNEFAVVFAYRSVKANALPYADSILKNTYPTYDSAVYLYDTIEEARNSFLGFVSDTVKLLKEDGINPKVCVDHESYYAKIQYPSGGETDFQEIYVSRVYE